MTEQSSVLERLNKLPAFEVVKKQEADVTFWKNDAKAKRVMLDSANEQIKQDRDKITALTARVAEFEAENTSLEQKIAAYKAKATGWIQVTPTTEK